MEVVAKKEVIDQKNEFFASIAGFLGFHTNNGSSTGISLATLDIQPYIQNVFKHLIAHQNF